MSHEPKSPSLIIGSEEWVESFPDGLYDLAMELTLQSVDKSSASTRSTDNSSGTTVRRYRLTNRPNKDTQTTPNYLSS